jgi:uncharacterized protein YndB with AHSA1/START domain
VVVSAEMDPGMVTIEQEIHVASAAATVFAAIIDLPGYSRWLATSKAYPGTTEISSDPITLGTTYVEATPTGIRHGIITELEAPTRVAFHQPMRMRPRFLGTIDITVRYTLIPAQSGVRLHRAVSLTLPVPLRLVRPFVVRQFRTEINRTMLALKAFVESHP